MVPLSSVWLCADLYVTRRIKIFNKLFYDLNNEQGCLQGCSEMFLHLIAAYVNSPHTLKLLLASPWLLCSKEDSLWVEANTMCLLQTSHTHNSRRFYDIISETFARVIYHFRSLQSSCVWWSHGIVSNIRSPSMHAASTICGYIIHRLKTHL